MAFNVVELLRDREDFGSTRVLAESVRYHRSKAFGFSDEKCLTSTQKEAINWLDLDHAEHRYLLAASSDCSVTGYDVAVPSQPRSIYSTDTHAPLFKIDRGSPGGHNYAITCVAWYPVDTGLFITGGHDKEVKVWDTNHLQLVAGFVLPARVATLAMSVVATSHCLVAVGAGNPIKLCDPASGAFTHTLTGHQSDVWATCWSLCSEWHLLSGSVDGQVRLWDIRTSGCVTSFDQHRTTSSRLQPSGLQRNHRQRVGLIRGNNCDHGRAHEGSVTGIVASPDGLNWATAGTDSRVRLWDTHHYRNRLVNFERTSNHAVKPRQLAMDGDGQILFHPSGSAVQALDVQTGQQQFVLRGHLESINACCYNAHLQELYTAGNDHQIIVWAAQLGFNTEVDIDTWSDE